MKAFPHMAKVHMLDGNSIIKEEITSGGMDLRDYFAAKAMPLAFKVWENYHQSDENDSTYKTSNFQADGSYQQLIADTAYQMADAMMEARK